MRSHTHRMFNIHLCIIAIRGHYCVYVMLCGVCVFVLNVNDWFNMVNVHSFVSNLDYGFLLSVYICLNIRYACTSACMYTCMLNDEHCTMTVAVSTAYMVELCNICLGKVRE